MPGALLPCPEAAQQDSPWVGPSYRDAFFIAIFGATSALGQTEKAPQQAYVFRLPLTADQNGPPTLYVVLQMPLGT